MAIEIRELIIKTVVQQDNLQSIENNQDMDHSKLRQELLDECRKMIRDERHSLKYSR